MILSASDAVGRLVLALILGGLVGIERETHGRSAGLRTHALVSLAMCLLMVISLDVPNPFMAERFIPLLRIDPGRLAAGALAGMGFIGAGVVLKGRGSIRGVTTAASLWTVSAVGLTAGMGHYVLAVTTCALALVVLMGLRSRQLEKVLHRDTYTRLHVSGPRRADLLPAVEAVLARYEASVIFVSVTHNLVSGNVTYRFALRFKKYPNWEGLTNDIAAVPRVERLIWLQGLVP